MKLFFFVSSICGFATVAWALQSQSTAPDRVMNTRRPEIVEWGWVNKPWTGSDSPYVGIKRRIDVQFKNKNEKQIESITQKYRSAAAAKPKDPLSQYAWAYSAYAGRPIGAHIDRRDLPYIAMSLGEPKAPNSYEYNRVRFVVTARWLPYLQLKPLGIRLLQRNPKDYEVKRGVIRLLAVSSNSEQQQAITYAQQLVQAYPERSSAYSSLAWSYEMMFASKKDSAIGDKAIAAYNRCLTLSKSPINRASVQSHIRIIQREQERLRAKGNG